MEGSEFLTRMHGNVNDHGATVYQFYIRLLNEMEVFSPDVGDKVKSSKTSFSRASSIFSSRLSNVIIFFVLSCRNENMAVRS